MIQVLLWDSGEWGSIVGSATGPLYGPGEATPVPQSPSVRQG